MKIICDYNKCTGCAACVNACSHHCIKLVPDKLGELHPIIDQERCVDCNLCQSVCPNNCTLDYRYPSRCIASWIENVEKRRKCASGGIGTVLSEYVIKNGGVVFGSRYDDRLTPIITYTESLDDLDYFKGSRYVQSVISDETFKSVLYFLRKGKMVLFIGTPCQVAGLLCYLRKPYDNLITVDLMCHGVCPVSYFTDEINHLKNKYKIKDIADIRFRGNDGNNFILSMWDSKGNRVYPRNTIQEKFFLKDYSEQYYITGFLLGVSLRENCYSCNYARPERVSDITIGDFIGLGEKESFGYSTNNVSAVLLNTTKGERLFVTVSASMGEMQTVERTYAERLAYKPSLIHPYERHPLNSVFRNELINKGFSEAIRFALKQYMKDSQKNKQREVPLIIMRKITKSISDILRIKKR